MNFGLKKPKLYFYGSIGANFYWPFDKEGIDLGYRTMHLHKSQMHIWKITRRLYTLLTHHY